MKKFFSRFPIITLTIILMFVVNVLVVFGAIYVANEIFAALFEGAANWIRMSLNVLMWLIVFITVLNIINRDMIPEAKAPWLVVVMILNVFGVAVYAVFSHNRPSKRVRKKFAKLYKQSLPYHEQTVPKETVEKELGRWAGLSAALSRGSSAAHIYRNTATEYFPTGQDFFQRLKTDLESAEKFIFMEYFILEKGKMWNEILEILTRKVQEGVEVRVLYDDIGCMGKVRAGYYRELRKKGIRCQKFSPFVPVVTNVHNNRDHRKITVIDGKIGYTGGINLADEYINEVQPFGEWKDTAVRLEGEGVRNLTLMFLQMYNFRNKEPDKFSDYLTEEHYQMEANGFVQTYGAGPRPLYPRSVGEDVYLNIINEAKDYLYITTPYLIIDYRLREALIRAATRGVDVRIVLPHIPDKKIIFELTRSNYIALIRGGVKIYEYTPGFVHAKSFLADGEVGVVGTVNLDYRSLIHHYENGAILYKTDTLNDLKQDFENMFGRSELQTETGAKKGVFGRVICEIAKVFAPLF